MSDKFQRLYERVRKSLPVGYSLVDTGAPRGERRYWVLKKGDEPIKESYRLRDIADFLDPPNRSTDG